MIPKTLSASAVHVADACLRRYTAENYNRAPGFKHAAANLGTTCHAALEDYINDCYLKVDPKPPALELLLGYFDMHSIAYFGSTDYEFYAEGKAMLVDWHHRTDFAGVEVISTEVKTSFDLPTSIGPIKFNYIWDRFDKIGPRSYKVVDYKTNRWAFGPEDLHHKIQARAYALAAAIQLKAEGIDYDEIWIEFDLLRHGPVGTKFTREDNTATWNKLISIAESIIKTDEKDPPATLNGECVFCTVKTTCPLLLKNISAGGIMSLDRNTQVDLRSQLDFQRKAIAAAINDIDTMLLKQAEAEDEIEYTTSANRMRVVVTGRRSVDADRVARIVGPEIFSGYGGSPKLTMEQFKKLKADPRVSPELVNMLDGAVETKYGDPTIKIESRGFVDE